MLVLVSNPIGVDLAIEKAQKRLHDELLTKWGINTNMFLCYGRCYRNNDKNGVIPEVYSNGEYKELLLNDNVIVHSFFDIGNVINYETEEHQNSTTIDLVFFVNLNKLYSNNLRQDEKVRQDVQLIFEGGKNGLLLQTISIGNQALSEYSGYKKDAMKFKDMNQYHIFKMTYQLNYDYQSYQCSTI